MANNKVSIVIAALNEPYLDRTIADAFNKAQGELEVIAVLDGYKSEIKEHKNQIIIYHSQNRGQRQSINHAARLATGKYIFKVDAHCIFDEGFDLKLAKDCEYDWTVIPRRHGVKEEEWKPRITNIDYMRLTSPSEPGDLGLRATAWMNYQHNGQMIDDVMTCQGSGWFMHKDRFWELGGLDEGYGHWGAMGCEVGCKAWLSGGLLKVNKNTWYAHWQRGRKHTKGDDVTTSRFYHLPRQVVKDAHAYAKDLWFNNKWPLQKRDFKWLLEKFAPVPGWQDGYPELLTKSSSVVEGKLAPIAEPEKDKIAIDTLSYVIEKFQVKGETQEYYLNILRDDLLVLFKELGFKTGCEVGVFKGAYSRLMLDTIPDLKLYCVDCWLPVGRRNEKRQRRYYAMARTNLRPYRRTGQVHFVKKWSMDAVRDFEDESLDFVYIDANHNFDFVMQDIIEWSKKVRKGGIVSGHDFHMDKGKVILAVRTYTESHKINPWFVLGDEVQGKKSKNSWFWVKC